MYSFIICIIALVLGYILYGRFVERVFCPDPSRVTPAFEKTDGVDYVPMSAWRVYMVQFLNIAGTGPIFGAIITEGIVALVWAATAWFKKEKDGWKHLLTGIPATLMSAVVVCFICMSKIGFGIPYVPSVCIGMAAAAICAIISIIHKPK